MAKRGRPRKRRVDGREAWLMGLYQVWLWKKENTAVEPEADQPLSHQLPAAPRPLAESSTAQQLHAQQLQGGDHGPR